MTETEKISEVLSAIAAQAKRLEEQLARKATKDAAVLRARIEVLDEYYEALAREWSRLSDEEFDRNADHSLRCTADRLNLSER